MSYDRLGFITLPFVLVLLLLTGGCAAPLAVSIGSYGADGVSLAESGKTIGDHFLSMVTKQDCALWRKLRNEDICRPRNGDHDPYHVNYDEPFRQQGEAGAEYAQPPHSNAGAPATSWDAGAYKPAATPSAIHASAAGVGARPTDALDRNAAQAAIQADGYKRVSILDRESNGTWRAKAYRGTTEVLLIVDPTGRVAMR